MVNKTGRQTAIPQLETATPRAANLPRVQFSRQPAGDVQGAGESVKQLADFLHGVSGKIENRLDKLAMEEGALEGFRAARSGSVELRRDGTIRGQAFDRAAQRTVSAIADSRMRSEAAAIFEQNKYDPEGLSGKLKSMINGHLSAGLPEEVKTGLQLDFDRLHDAYMSDAGRLQQEQVMDQDRAAALASVFERRKGIERLAFHAENDAEAAATMAAEIKGLQDMLLKHGPRGAFTFDGEEYPADPGRSGAYDLEDIQKILLDTTEQAAETRVLGKFRQTKGLLAKQAYLQAFESEFMEGESDLTLEQSDRLARGMRTEINSLRAQANGAARAVEVKLKAAQKILEAGGDPGSDQLDAIESQARLSGSEEAVAAVHEARQTFAFQKEIRQLPPADLQSWINLQREDLREEKNPDVAAIKAGRIDLAENILSTMQTELNRDPLSWAAKTGLVNVKPIAFAGEGSAESMQGRLETALAVQNHYGGSLKLLTNEEKSSLVEVYNEQDADGRLALIGSIQQGFGSEAIRVFEQIGTDAPVLANVAGLMETTGGGAVTARDAMTGQRAMQDGLKVLPGETYLRDPTEKTIGEAYMLAPGTQAIVTETANAIYTAEAVRAGKANPDDFDKRLYRKALNRAAGAWYDERGARYGGFGEWRGNMVVLPPNISQDKFESLIGNLSETDLVAISVGGGGPVHENGKMVSPEELAGYYLVSTGPGKYAVSRTDPKKEPNWIMGTGRAGIYEIDLTRLKGARP